MAVVKEVCSESMLGAQEEAKNRPGYHANGEVTNVDLDEIMEVFPYLFLTADWSLCYDYNEKGCCYYGLCKSIHIQVGIIFFEKIDVHLLVCHH